MEILFIKLIKTCNLLIHTYSINNLTIYFHEIIELINQDVKCNVKCNVNLNLSTTEWCFFAGIFQEKTNILDILYIGYNERNMMMDNNFYIERIKIFEKLIDIIYHKGGRPSAEFIENIKKCNNHKECHERWIKIYKNIKEHLELNH